MDDLKALPDVLDGRHHVIPIVTGGDEVLEEVNVPEVLPILTLRSSVLFPGAITPITVGREKSIRLVREVNERNGLLGAVLQRESEVEDPAPDDMYKVGTAARIIKILEMPNGNLTVILNGLEKIEVKEYVSTEPYFQASVTPLRDSSPDVKSLEFEALVDSIRDIALGIIDYFAGHAQGGGVRHQEYRLQAGNHQLHLFEPRAFGRRPPVAAGVSRSAGPCPQVVGDSGARAAARRAEERDPGAVSSRRSTSSSAITTCSSRCARFRTSWAKVPTAELEEIAREGVQEELAQGGGRTFREGDAPSSNGSIPPWPNIRCKLPICN